MYDQEADDRDKALAYAIIAQVGVDIRAPRVIRPLGSITIDDAIRSELWAGEWELAGIDALQCFLDGRGNVSPDLVEQALEQWPLLQHEMSNVADELRSWLAERLVAA